MFKPIAKSTAHKKNHHPQALLMLACVGLLSGCQTVVQQPAPTQNNTPVAKLPKINVPAIIIGNLPTENRQPPILIEPSQTPSEGTDPIEQKRQAEARKEAEKKRLEQLKRAEAKRQQTMRAGILNAQKANNSARKRVSIKDGTKLPAFNRLMTLGVKQLRNNQLNAAKQNFIAAQRLAPQSPAVYMYLSEIALKQKQATKAENLARRGLVVSRSKRYDNALWRMILLSGKMRNRSDIVNEAKKKLLEMH